MKKTFFQQYKYVLFAIFAFIYFYFIRDYSSLITLKSFDVLLVVAIFGYFSWVGYEEKMKNASYQLVGVADHTSLGDVPIPIYADKINYMLFRRGGYSYIGFSHKGDDGVVVVPEVYVSHIAGNYAYFAIPHEVELSFLPLAVQDYILQNDLKGPYYLALIPSSHLGVKDSIKIKDDVISYSAFANAIENANKVITEQRDLLRNKFETIDKFNSTASNTSQSFNTNASFLKTIEKYVGGNK